MKKVILTIITAISFAGCDKKNILPEISQIGANTFGCKMDCKQYAVKGSEAVWDNTNGGYVYTPTNIDEIFGNLDFKAIYDDRILFIRILDGQSAGDISDKFYAELDANGKLSEYSLNKSKPNKLNLLRADNNIYAGTFDFWLSLDSDSTDQIHITEGRFDLLSRQ